MTSLRELQARLYRAVALERSLTIESPSPNLDARLDVYRNNARETFRRALASTYPIVRQLVGDACFRTLARACERDFPSRSGDLGAFGAEFPVLLDVAYRDTAFAYLADVARLEAAIAAAETAPDPGPVDFGRLARLAPRDFGTLVFELHPAARLLDSRWPVLRIWRAHRGGEPGVVDLGAGAERVLVTRRPAGVKLHALDAGAFVFARGLADGETLSDALDVAVAADADFDPRATLTLLAALGALAGFRLARDGLD